MHGGRHENKPIDRSRDGGARHPVRSCWRRIIGAALIIHFVLVAAITCGIWIGVLHVGDPDSWYERALAPHPLSLPVPLEALVCAAGLAALFGGVLLLTTTGRLLWHERIASRALRAVRQPPSPELWDAAIGLVPKSRLFHLEDNRPYAVCVGLWQPSVYVSTGLVTRLAPDAVRAALAHEESHRRRRDPLRLLLLRVVARWIRSVPWSTRLLANVELRAEILADRFARSHASTAALAAALLCVLRHAGAATLPRDAASVRTASASLDGPSHVHEACHLPDVCHLDERLRYLALSPDTPLPPVLPGGLLSSITLPVMLRGLSWLIGPSLLAAASSIIPLVLFLLLAHLSPLAVGCASHS